MKYSEAYSSFCKVEMIWRIHIDSNRYVRKALRLFAEAMQPKSKIFYKSSFPLNNGYQMDLMSLTIEHEDATVPSSLPSYPDW